MPIISEIGRKDPKIKLLIGSIYATLTIGAVTMIYPFLLMISGSTKSSVDAHVADIIPPYLISDEALYQKHCERLFNERYETLRMTYNNAEIAFSELKLPTSLNHAYVDEWAQFVEANPTLITPFTYNIGYIYTPESKRVVPRLTRDFRNELKRDIAPDIEQVNIELNTIFSSWNHVLLIPRPYLLRGNLPTQTPFDQAYYRFKARQAHQWRTYLSVQGFYRNYLNSQYVRIENYNKAHNTDYASFRNIPAPSSISDYPPEAAQQRQDWETFVRTIINIMWLEVSPQASEDYRAFLQAKYMTIENYNHSYNTEISDFASIQMPTKIDMASPEASDWTAFLSGWKDPKTDAQHMLDIAQVTITSIDYQFIDFLKNKYRSLGRLNQELNTEYTTWDQVSIPQRDIHFEHFQASKGALRWNFTIRNYIDVVDYLLLHGRGIYNTLIYCTFSILAAIIVNPLAAYALSRFKPPFQYPILLFLMVTMAFPPMVTQIPVFLQLRSFGMLNTFFALILPVLANGYAIFLLKGFFDALPTELFESAQMDGAGEFRIFWNIAMALSKPILAVIALNAFSQAYSAFLFALLICQDQEMWTLMVWLYQLQQGSSQGIIFASLLIGALPTFFVFIFCQNIIIRGIIIPVEK